jgi:phosphoglycerate kinase
MRTHKFVAIPRSLKNKTVLLRTDFNEPIIKGRIADSFRISSVAPTIRELKKRGARIVIASHLEHNDRPVSFGRYFRELERLLGTKLVFTRRVAQPVVRHALTKGVVLLENMRFQKGEESNSPILAKVLASFSDVYINEAFSVSHRRHASISAITRLLPSFAGPLFRREVDRLSEALKPAHPFLLIIGGAKFKTKFALLKCFVSKTDAIFVGGVLANTFLTASGMSVGKSVMERGAIKDISKHFTKSKKILLPFDVMVEKKGGPINIYDVGESDFIVDIGPETVNMIIELARLSKYVLWNGPLGYTERGYDKGTLALLRGLARLKSTKVILGGGDTLEVMDQMKTRPKFYHVSTGGGAMLDFLADGTLEGIEALKKSKKSI